MNTPTATAVRGLNLVKSYGSGETHIRALDQVSLSVPSGRFVAVMGPSGSGKSTLMHTLAGLDGLDSGEVWISEIPISGLGDRELTVLRRERIGFIFQAFNLLPTLTAKQNILLPLTIAGRKVEEAWFDRIVNELGLAGRLSHHPHQLSGGQQQRVAIARALVTKPAVIFADEPTGNLDSISGKRILDLLRHCVSALGQTVIMVTHDPKAASYADQVILLSDGRVCAQLDDPRVETILAAFDQIETGEEETDGQGGTYAVPAPTMSTGDDHA